jgi:four helix bundle protein
VTSDEVTEAKLSGHRDLVAWQEAMHLAKAIYELTATFPKEELYGLTSQMRRAAVSIPSNIAEGAGRSGNKEFKQFLMIARGSLSELETQLILAQELGFAENATRQIESIQKLFRILGGLLRSIGEKA